MSQENIVKFAEFTSTDPALQRKIQAIQAIQAQAASETAEKIAALSTEAGTPFTAEEFLAASQARANDMSDEDLSHVAGGTWQPSSTNIMTSVFAFGIGCVHGQSPARNDQPPGSPAN